MTLAYFDTSALVPLVIAEASTVRCVREWDRATGLVTTSLSFVEVHAALAQATRHGRLTEQERRQALAAFDSRWRDAMHVSPSDDIIESASQLTAMQALRGYDAVHCATALAVASDDFVAVAGDRRLLEAWRELGVATIDTAR